MSAAQFAAKSLDVTRNDEDDLFDAVLTGSVDKEKRFPSNQMKNKVKTEENEKPNAPPETSSIITPSKRLGVYIGKFPWWITHDDIALLVHRLGVRDITLIEFAENKANGLSKGFVEVVVISEESKKLLLDKVPRCKLGGESLTCRCATRNNRLMFEGMSEQGVPGFPPRAAPSSNVNEPEPSFLPQNPFQPSMPPPFLNQFPNTFPPMPNPFLRFPPPPLPLMPPPPLLPMFLNLMKSASNLQTQHQLSDSAMAGTSQVGHSSSTSRSDEQTDNSFEELINRNRAVASAAINKAVTGATTGDMTVAMETLLTAISIIKQSRVSGDDRCQALVTSLKDCLVSIQKSCGYSRHSEERERDRRKSSSSERRRSSRDFQGDRDRSWNRERSRGHSEERYRDREGYRDGESSRDREERYRDREEGYRDGERYRDREEGYRDGERYRDREERYRDREERYRDGERSRDREDGYRDREEGYRDREERCRDREEGYRDREEGFRNREEGFRDREERFRDEGFRDREERYRDRDRDRDQYYEN